VLTATEKDTQKKTMSNYSQAPNNSFVPGAAASSPILYSLISRGSSILTRQASCAGNFAEVTDEVLARISHEDGKMSYSHGSYLFHYICENRIIFMCITEDNFERSKAFAFLNEIKKRFMNQYGERVHTALPYAMNSDFSSTLMAQMRYFSELPSPSHANLGSRGGNNAKMNQVQGQVDELKGIMVKNIDQITARGERLELLVNRTEHLQANAVTFKRTSRNLERSMCMKNAKLSIIFAIIAIAVIYFVVCACCGGLDWRTCVR